MIDDRKEKLRCPLSPVSFLNVGISGGYWGRRVETVRTVTIPLEYEMNRKTGALASYQWESERDKDRPWRIWVGDVGKWTEAAAYCLGVRPDRKLAELAEHAVHEVIRGQKPDGYLYCNVTAPARRWTNLRDLHELYDVGHAIEGAVAYYQATGKRDFLDTMCRCADLLEANFGDGPGKQRGYDGHPEVELALVKLYRSTGERRYLDLAKFFVDERGRQPHYFDQEAAARGEDPKNSWTHRFSPGAPHLCFQAHRPVRQQDDAVGHAVRALYLYSGMADVAVETGDEELLAACQRLWMSAVHRRMYVIGGVGSSSHGEAFTCDYDLPNETAYAETCANIALVFFAHRMLQIKADSEYADVMERALYNGVLSGLSLDGRTFFYANHLTAYPKGGNAASDHVAPARQEWFGCACCPPNIARVISGIGQFVYSTSSDGLYVHLYMGGRVKCQVGGTQVTLKQETDYPWKGKVHFTLDPESPARFDLALRIPGWCRRPNLRVNGKVTSVAAILRSGYACVRRDWAKGDEVELTLPMPVERVEAHPSVRANCGRVALQRGPLVYCLEEVDNGPDLADLFLPRTSRLTVEYRKRLLGGVAVIRGKGFRRSRAGWKDQLYRSTRSRPKAVGILAIPYALWANRGTGEMVVWVRGG
ncbi:MAG: glycoside hydrolase family 127 protein [Armatimonadetes bacterium]|nr:glycoside hydrolase family 127 protein [Armatimonadota bacterium]